MNNQSYILQCTGLTKSYREGPEELIVLDNLNLQVRRGEKLAIIGSSGSGKTTLLNMLGGLDTPSRGEVEIAGQNIAAMNEAERGRFRNHYLGFVYQFHHLLPEFTALENVAMPLLIRGVKRKEAYAQAQALLETVGLKARERHKPGELSGGERQRVAIARALVTEPRCVLLDEPTGNLDHHTAQRIHELMLQLSESSGTTFVTVTHDQELASRMDRIFKLEDGELLEQTDMEAVG